MMVDQIAFGGTESPTPQDLRREALDLILAVKDLVKEASTRRKPYGVLAKDNYAGAVMIVNLAIVYGDLTDSMVRNLRTKAQSYISSMDL